MTVRKSLPPISPQGVPDPETFRKWLRQALAALELGPTAFGKDVGLGHNTLSQFLSGATQDIRMSTAHLLSCSVASKALERDIPLPSFRDVVDPGSEGGS